MCSDGCDPYESGQPFLFGAAEREESLRELEAKRKADERKQEPEE